jgi:ketosteroid isomerase-like protein
MDLDEVYAQFKPAWSEFGKGKPEPAKAMFSHSEDATLANPFGGAVRGWDEVSKTLDYASSRFSDGELLRIDRLAEYATSDLVCLLEMEHWQVRVGEHPDVEPVDLRVTTTLRREGDGWKIVHRHADPLTSFDPNGPLRGSTG